MPFVKGKSGNLKGRPPGIPNKITAVARDVIAGAAAELGGQERLVAWAKEDPSNERIFWGSIFPKMLPITLAGDKEAPLALHITREVISK